MLKHTTDKAKQSIVLCRAFCRYSKGKYITRQENNVALQRIWSRLIGTRNQERR